MLMPDGILSRSFMEVKQVVLYYKNEKTTLYILFVQVHKFVCLDGNWILLWELYLTCFWEKNKFIVKTEDNTVEILECDDILLCEEDYLH